MPAELPHPQAAAVTPSEYNEFISGVGLLNVRLCGAEIRSPYIYVENSHEQLSHRFSSSASYTNFAAGFVTTARFDFEGFYPSREEQKVEVRVDMELIYSSPVGMSDRLFAIFEQRNVPLNALPFWREFVHNALARCGWPVFTLPLFKGVPRAPKPSPEQPKAAELAPSAKPENPAEKRPAKRSTSPKKKPTP